MTGVFVRPLIYIVIYHGIIYSLSLYSNSKLNLSSGMIDSEHNMRLMNKMKWLGSERRGTTTLLEVIRK